jgi:hypothetical protein
MMPPYWHFWLNVVKMEGCKKHTCQFLCANYLAMMPETLPETSFMEILIAKKPRHSLNGQTAFVENDAFFSILHMENHKVKEKLVKIFTETKYISASITPEFKEQYIEAMWKSLFTTCETAIRTGMKYIVIDDFCVNAFDLKFPTHERDNVYQAMKDTIQAKLNAAGIPFIVETSIYNPNKTKFKIDIDELKKFSNHEKLQGLL